MHARSVLGARTGGVAARFEEAEAIYARLNGAPPRIIYGSFEKSAVI